MKPVLRSQRGIALVITLLVVTLLAITVVDFTFSVQVDQHMARNALSALQASLLARSGINLGEAFLAHDDDPLVDGYTEDWGQMEELNSQLILPENMRLRIEIIDESGKFNLNSVLPNYTEWRLIRNNPNPQQPRPVEWYHLALERLLAAQGVDAQVAQAVKEYADRMYEPYEQSRQPPGVPGGPTPTPLLTTSQVNLPPTLYFPSLDDAGVVPGFTPALIRRLRPLMSALRVPQVNVNTAPREVLQAILDDEGVVDSIVSQRQEVALNATDLGQLLAGLDPQNLTGRYARTMLGVRSHSFLIRTSAIVNPNPITGLGGISRSASMLVRREWRVTHPGQPPRWTLTRLDWQKEGGAALFLAKTSDEAGGDMSSEMGR